MATQIGMVYRGLPGIEVKWTAQKIDENSDKVFRVFADFKETRKWKGSSEHVLENEGKYVTPPALKRIYTTFCK